MSFRFGFYVRWALLLAMLLLAPAVAQAQVQGPDCDSDVACAQLAEQAYNASQEGRFDDAQRAYDQAYRLKPDPKLLYNLARVLHKAGRFAAAVPYYQKYIALGAGGNTTQLHKAEEYQEEARLSATSAPRGTPDSLKTPVYRKWWLWTTVGVVVAGVAVGVGLGLLSRRPDTTGAYQVTVGN